MKKQNILLSSLMVFLAFNVCPSKSESYIGIQAGASFANELTDSKADVNGGHPVAPGPIFVGSKLTDSRLNDSFSIGAKVGHYFDVIPFFGIEGEFNYTNPDFPTQNIVLSNPALPGSIVKTQFKADIYDFAAGASLMVRYPLFKRVMPYIGVGPNLHYFRVRGTGNDINPMLPGVVLPGPEINQDKVALGVQAKAGLRLAATKHLAFDIEYKYNYSPVRLDQWRGLANLTGSYDSQQLCGAVVYRFGKIKW
jgi:opacity protein-like surface antigen